MIHWWIVFEYELRRSLGRKAYLLATFGIPLLAAVLILGYLAYGRLQESDTSETEVTQSEFENTPPIGYVDKTAYFTPPPSGNPLADLVIRYDTLVDGEHALKSGEIDGLYVIESDYFQTGRVTQWMEKFNFESLTNNLMEAFLIQSLARGTEPEIIARLRIPIMDVQEQLISTEGASQGEENFGGNFILVYVFALGLMIATFTASGYLLQSVVDEKENYTIEIILTSVKPFPLLFGKTLAMGLVGLLQIGVWAISIAILLNTTSLDLPEVGKLEVKPETVVVAMVYFLFGYLFTGSIFAAMGSLVNNARDGSQLAGWIIFPTIAPLFFTTVFAEEPNTTLPTLLSIMPFTAPLGMVMRVAVTDVPLYQILISLIGVTATSLLGIWIAGRLFRVSSLLRGTPPRIRDIPRLIWEKT